MSETGRPEIGRRTGQNRQARDIACFCQNFDGCGTHVGVDFALDKFFKYLTCIVRREARVRFRMQADGHRRRYHSAIEEDDRLPPPAWRAMHQVPPCAGMRRPNVDRERATAALSDEPILASAVNNGLADSRDALLRQVRRSTTGARREARGAPRSGPTLVIGSIDK